MSHIDLYNVHQFLSQTHEKWGDDVANEDPGLRIEFHYYYNIDKVKIDFVLIGFNKIS